MALSKPTIEEMAPYTGNAIDQSAIAVIAKFHQDSYSFRPTAEAIAKMTPEVNAMTNAASELNAALDGPRSQALTRLRQEMPEYAHDPGMALQRARNGGLTSAQEAATKRWGWLNETSERLQQVERYSDGPKFWHRDTTTVNHEPVSMRLLDRYTENNRAVLELGDTYNRRAAKVSESVAASEAENLAAARRGMMTGIGAAILGGATNAAMDQMLFNGTPYSTRTQILDLLAPLPAFASARLGFAAKLAAAVGVHAGLRTWDKLES